MSQLLLWFGLLEVFGAIAIDQTLRGSGREAGDFGESLACPPLRRPTARARFLVPSALRAEFAL